MRVPALLKLPASQCRKPCVAGNQGSLVALALVSRLAGVMLRAACHVRLLLCFSWICWACGRVQGHKRLQSVGSYRLRAGPVWHVTRTLHAQYCLQIMWLLQWPRLLFWPLRLCDWSVSRALYKQAACLRVPGYSTVLPNSTPNQNSIVCYAFAVHSGNNCGYLQQACVCVCALVCAGSCVSFINALAICCDQSWITCIALTASPATLTCLLTS